jgi:hypothetical protein
MKGANQYCDPMIMKTHTKAASEFMMAAGLLF